MWLNEIRRHIENNLNARVTTSVLSAGRTVLNYRDAKQTFTVTIDVVEAPMGGRCLSIQARTGESALLNDLLESFDGMFVVADIKPLRRHFS